MQTKQKQHFQTIRQKKPLLNKQQTHQTSKQTEVIIFLIKAILGSFVFYNYVRANDVFLFVGLLSRKMIILIIVFSDRLYEAIFSGKQCI